MNIGAMYSFTRSPSYTNATKNVSNGNSANLMLGFVSNISSNVDFNITSMTGYSYATNTAKENTKYLNENVTARLNIIFLKGFVFNTDYSYRYYYNASSSGFTQSYSLWNAGIGRKFLKRRTAEVRVTMYDILKQNKNLQHNIADNYIQDSWTNTLGRYVMATFSYRFNSMNALSKPSSNGGFDTNGPSRRMEGGGNRGGGMGGGGYRQGGGFH